MSVQELMTAFPVEMAVEVDSAIEGLKTEHPIWMARPIMARVLVIRAVLALNLGEKYGLTDEQCEKLIALLIEYLPLLLG